MVMQKIDITFYFEGQILPFVDPMTFRLKVPGSVYQGGYPGDYSDDYPANPRDEYDPYYNEGYVVTLCSSLQW